MTEERRRELDDELDAAIASGDGPKIKQVRRKMDLDNLTFEEAHKKALGLQ